VRRASGDVPEPKFLPGLVGRTVDEARTVLKELGLRAAIKLQPDDGPEGLVLAQSPAEGTALQDLKSVELAVSKAREASPETALVPELVGKPRELALELLKATDLKGVITETTDAAADAGVIRQEPRAGTPVARKTVVQITVNTPPKPEPDPIAVPQLVGRGADEAKKLLSTLGLKTVTTTEASTAPEGEVLRQDPAADARVAAGSTVALTLSTGKAAKRPDLDRLIAAMAENPRAKKAGLTAARIRGGFMTADIATPEAARRLSEGTAKEIGARVGLTVAAEATVFRAALLAALKALG